MKYFLLSLWCVCALGGEVNLRTPSNEAELRGWLENMVWHHRFSVEEVENATGLKPSEIQSALERFGIGPEQKPKRAADAPLLVLPYPGGRHPRIGFLDGAINPQRETKLSVFLPWNDSSYVVADVPEAIWSNLGLTYLAHTHIPTVWDRREVKLPALEWERLENGDYKTERTLPNGIRFGTLARPTKEALRMKQWLHNGTSEALSALRVQNCVMLKGAKGFETQSNTNKVFQSPFVAVHSADKRRWIITAWIPIHRVWGNAPVPCLHSDPKFPDAKPGETRTVTGWLSFYEGSDLAGELKRIEPLLGDWFE